VAIGNGDLISGKGNSHVATLVETYSRFTVLVRANGKDTKFVVDALAKKATALPKGLWKSLTWDRGSELADHQSLASKTGADIYFCDPASPWQRGTNENTNRLLRQYFPKGMDLSIHSQADLEEVAEELNQRPRKVLGFSSPEDNLASSGALTT
jgi:IS30 family transposase